MFQPKKKHAHTMIPRPPSSGRPTSRTRLRHLTSASKNVVQPLSLPSKHVPLPPVGQTVAMASVPSSPIVTPTGMIDTTLEVNGNEDTMGHLSAPSSASQKAKEAFESAKLSRLPSVQEDQPHSSPTPAKMSTPLLGVNESDSLQAILKQAQLSGLRKEIKELSQELQEATRSPTSSRKKDNTLDYLKESLSLRPNTSTRGLDKLLATSGRESAAGRPTTSSKKEKTLDTLGRPTTSSKYSNLERKQGIVLESLSHTEARGLLRQASLERLGSSKISSYIQSTSKSRAGFSLSGGGQGRIGTPEGRIVVSGCYNKLHYYSIRI